MIVIHKIIADIAYPINISQPKKTAQSMLAIGCLLKFESIVCPNGINVMFANLKHCFPKGIPMIVIHRINPRKNQIIEVKIPPRSSHMILKIRFNNPFFLFAITIILYQRFYRHSLQVQERCILCHLILHLLKQDRYLHLDDVVLNY